MTEVSSAATRLWAVCEIPSQHRERYPWQYEVATELPTFLRLHGDMTDDEVATAIAGLCSDNEVPVCDDIAQTLRSLHEAAADRSELILCGGLQLRAGSKTLSPGCCCGLEHWREWPAVLETGEPVWWGHDPDGQVELIDNSAVRATSGSDFVDLTRAEYATAVAQATNDLTAFATRLRRWFHVAAPSLAASTTALVARELKIPYSS